MLSLKQKISRLRQETNSLVCVCSLSPNRGWGDQWKCSAGCGEAANVGLRPGWIGSTGFYLQRLEAMRSRNDWVGCR